jgi:Bacterial TSP3 repeat
MDKRWMRVLTMSGVLAVGGVGCVAGTVSDANTKSGLAGVKITANGTCSGSGCGSGSGQQVSKSTGLWAFDAYGDLNGEDNVQIVLPAPGEEAIAFKMSKLGYNTTTLYHRTDYKTHHHNGKDYLVSSAPEVFLCTWGSPDSDNDGLCNAAELAYGTNPNNADTDGDRLGDRAEVLGINGVDLRYFGASATHKDVFVYVDYYVKPIQAALDRVTAAFAAAPVNNPDGKTGINLHLVLGKQIAPADKKMNLVGPVSGNWAEVDVIKNKYFPARYAPFMHYLLVAHQYDGGSSSGISRGIPAHDFLVTLGAWPTPYGTELQQAGTLMHELGHNLGLRHGGNENVNRKPNYFSVMSYTYQVVGLHKGGVDGVLDYSRVRVAGLSENALNEFAGMAAVAPTTEADLLPLRPKFGTTLALGNASGPLDFNLSSAFNVDVVAADLNGNGTKTDSFIASQNDWLALIYSGSAAGGGAIGGAAAGLDAVDGDSIQIVAPDQMEPELAHE